MKDYFFNVTKAYEELKKEGVILKSCGLAKVV